MQRCLGDQRIVVLLSKSPRILQCACEDADGLKLRPAVTDAIFIDCECLDEELICGLFEAALVGDLAACNE